MTATRFSPFKNETDRLRIGDLTVENRLDRISLYGSLDINPGLEGLEAVRELMEVLGLIMLQLSHTPLADTTWTGSDH